MKAGARGRRFMYVHVTNVGTDPSETQPGPPPLPATLCAARPSVPKDIFLAGLAPS